MWLANRFEQHPTPVPLIARFPFQKSAGYRKQQLFWATIHWWFGSCSEVGCLFLLLSSSNDNIWRYFVAYFHHQKIYKTLFHKEQSCCFVDLVLFKILHCIVFLKRHYGASIETDSFQDLFSSFLKISATLPVTL